MPVHARPCRGAGTGREVRLPAVALAPRPGSRGVARAASTTARRGWAVSLNLSDVVILASLLHQGGDFYWDEIEFPV